MPLTPWKLLLQLPGLVPLSLLPPPSWVKPDSGQRLQEAARRAGPDKEGKPPLWDSMAGQEAPLPHDGQIEPLGFQLKWKIWNIRAVVAQSVSPPRAGRAGAPPGSSLGSGGFLVTSPGQGLHRVVRKMAMHSHSPWLEGAGARESLHLPSPRTGREPGRRTIAEGTAPQMLGNTKKHTDSKHPAQS